MSLKRVRNGYLGVNNLGYFGIHAAYYILNLQKCQQFKDNHYCIKTI